MKRLILLSLVVLACLAGAGCGLQRTVTQFCTDGPCPTGPHHWTPTEVARDVQSNLFPPHEETRDHPYRTVCRINGDGTRATCTGRRRFGTRPGERITVEMLLRENGTLDLICWPHPSPLCDSIHVSDQRDNPITD